MRIKTVKRNTNYALLQELRALDDIVCCSKPVQKSKKISVAVWEVPERADLAHLHDNMYYSVISGTSDSFGSETTIHFGDELKAKWKKLAITHYAGTARLPKNYMLIALPDDSCIAVKEYAVSLNK